MINIDLVENLQVSGVNPIDYPKFVDAFFDKGNWKDTGEELTAEQLDDLTADYPEIVNDMAVQFCV